MSKNLDAVADEDIKGPPTADEMSEDEAQFVLALRDAVRALDPIAHDESVRAVQHRIRLLIADEFEAWGIAYESVTEDMIDELVETAELVLKR